MIGARQLRDHIALGQPALGTFVAELKAPGVPQILANSGFRFVIIESEHGTLSFDQIRTLIDSTHASDITAGEILIAPSKPPPEKDWYIVGPTRIPVH